MGSEAESFNQSLADSYIGKTILVGIKYKNKNGEIIDREEVHGIIESASKSFIGVRLRGKHRFVNKKHIGDGLWHMPPMLDVIEIAEPGFYEIHSTGDTVDNPDLTARFLVTRRADQ